MQKYIISLQFDDSLFRVEFIELVPEKIVFCKRANVVDDDVVVVVGIVYVRQVLLLTRQHSYKNYF